MELKPGLRLRSAVDTTEVIVVRAPSDDVDLRCGGAPMLEYAAELIEGAEPAPEFADGTALGKRYRDEATGLELLCTKAGPGSLSLGDQIIGLAGTKPLPSSD